MSNLEKREIEACLFGYPPYERYGAPEPEVFIELYPLLTQKLRESVATQLFQLESTTNNQRELLWERFKPKIGELFLSLVESWKNVSQIDATRYDAVDVNGVALGDLKTIFPFPVDIVGFLEKKSSFIRPIQQVAYTEFLERLFKDSLKEEYFIESPINPLVGLLRLIQALPEKDRERVYRSIVASLVSERAGSDDERIFFELAPLLPDSLVTLAESVARGLHRDWAVEIMYKARSMPMSGLTPYQSNVYKWLGTRARLYLSEMPKKERDILLQSTIERLWERHSDVSFSLIKFFLPQPTNEKALGLKDIDEEREIHKEEGEASFPTRSRSEFMSETFRYKMTGPPVKAKPPLRIETPSIKKAMRKPSKTRKIVVNPGFAEVESPDKSIDRHVSLKPAHDYFFWIQIGKKLRKSIEKGKTEVLPGDLPEKALLKIALFPFKGELELGTNETGWMRLKLIDGQMTGVVKKQGSETARGVSAQRLLFRIKTPPHAGDYRLRCNIYYKQVLLQSRVITARVADATRPTRDAALRSIVDYSIGPTLNAPYLESLQEQDISLMLNDNDDGTHSLRVFDEVERNTSVDLDELGLKGMIAGARDAYREVSWGSKMPFKTGDSERYGVPPSFDVLKKDLIRLARQGYGLYDAIIGMTNLPEEFLEDIAKNHKHIEFVIKDETKTSSYIIPIALIYDHPLDDEGELGICPAFEDAYKRGRPIEETPCFNGACPSHGDLNVVCPSGFWGYRNSLGFPTARNSEINYTQEYEVEPTVCACANTSFSKWQSHLTELKRLTPNKPLREAYNKKAALKGMKEKNNVVYFYCHGDRENRNIFIRLGPANAPRISPSNLRANKIIWKDPKPLVFINGCNTAALEAEQVLNFVQPFLKYCNAAGVIGTDITVFESLATRFAEGCLRRFLRDGEPIGEAVRKTRIELLQKGNPLGLVYVPYVHDGLRLVKK